MALSGISCQKIADSLNRDHISTPAMYAGIHVGRVGPDTGLWQSERISEMLKNEVYTGNMVSRRREKINYKTRKCSANPPEKWLVVKNTHEPIVTDETFQAVALILNSRKSIRDTTHQSLLKGLIYCYECGEPLTAINRRNAAGEDCYFFMCRTYHRSPKAHLCTCHSIKEQTVTDAVLSRIQEECGKYLQPEVLLSIAKQAMAKANQQSRTESEIQSLESKLNALSNTMDQVSTDKLDGLLDLEDFQRIYDKLKAERIGLSQNLETLQNQRKPSNKLKPVALPLVQKFIEESVHRREFLVRLIERIEFSEDRQLYIKFRFKDPNTQ